MTKLILKQKAIELRKQGFSYNFIKGQVKVSKSTLNAWLADIPFNPNNEFIQRVNRTHELIKDLRRRGKENSEREAGVLALNDVGDLSKRDLFMLGLGIYMGEGSKTVGLRLVNSNPSVIKTGINWFKKVYGLTNEHFRVRIHIYPDCNKEESLNYWSNVTGLNTDQFHPVYVDRRENKKMRKTRKLLFGTAHVTIRSGNKREFGILLMRRILKSIEIVNKQAGLV